MSLLGTYRPDQVALIAVGVPVTGFAPGTFITAERNEDSFTLSVGSDGDACRTRTNNLSGRITFTLLQSSASNILLSAIANTDERSPAGDGILPSTVKDNSGTTLLTATKSWIVKPASVEYSNEATNREWVVETHELNMLVGGN
jgi:hypothetical protein